MKVLAFCDVHGDGNAMLAIEKKIAKHSPDLLICAGDITIFGNQQRMLIDWLNRQAVSSLIIPGNHEDAAELERDCASKKQITYLHKKTLQQNDYVFVGYGGDGFSRKDKSFEQFTASLDTEQFQERMILILHGPPHNTTLDLIDGKHCGNSSYTQFICKYKPLLVIAGHLHENFGKRQMLKRSLLLNPGPLGEIIDLGTVARIINS